MMRILGLTLLLFCTLPVLAHEARVKVKGMVCGFCAQGISKKFAKEKAVDKVNVNLDSKFVTIDFKNQKDLSDSEIEALISDAGFTVEKIERQRR